MSRGTNVTCSLIALTSLLLALSPSPAAAQATANPTRATFTASSDHNITSGSGTPAVESYEIGLYILGASQPFQRVSIGKPNPDGTGTITVDMTAAFVGWPVVGTSYTADVAAIGPGGTARSALSNTFSFTGGGACSFTVSSSTLNVPAAGGSYTATVATTTGCGWTGVSNDTGWITVTSGANATGNGTVAFGVAANTSTSARTGTLTIAGKTLTVTQAGACNFTLTPGTQNVAAAGGSQSVDVATTTGCGWTAVSNNTGWIAVTAGSSGTGNGTVAYNVSSNTSTSSRSGTLTIGGKTLAVTQAGTCSFTLTPGTQNVAAAGGSQSVSVATTTGCGWTAVSNNTGWIAVTAGNSGTGNGTVAYNVSSNTSTSSRTGTLTIGGKTLTVTQNGVAGGCTFTLSPTAHAVTGDGGTFSTNVSTQTGCTWTTVSNASWITVTSSTNRTASGTAVYTVATNRPKRTRTGTVTIAGQAVTITQTGGEKPGKPNNFVIVE